MFNLKAQHLTTLFTSRVEKKISQKIINNESKKHSKKNLFKVYVVKRIFTSIFRSYVNETQTMIIYPFSAGHVIISAVFSYFSESIKLVGMKNAFCVGQLGQEDCKQFT